MYKPITKVQLLKGGNVIKQGHDFTIEFNLFDDEGKLADLTGAVVGYKIAHAKGGIVSEGNAVNKGPGHISLTITEDIGSGDNKRVEFTVTKGGVSSKFPAEDFVRLKITPSLDNLEYTGVSTVTFEQFKKQADRAEEYLDGVEAALKDGPVQAVNGKTGVITGLAEQADLDKVKSSLADKANQAALETEKSRINNLVANAGDVTNNAELLDIRVTSDGTKEATAGEAIRKQIGQVKAEMSENYAKVKSGKNLYNPEMNFSGSFAGAVGNKTVISASETLVLQKVKINNKNDYTFTGIRSYGISDKNDIVLVGKITINPQDTVTILKGNIPPNSEYLWVNSYRTNASSDSQIEVGKQKTAYEPYKRFNGLETNGVDINMLEIDDTSTGNEKTWSSTKINNEISTKINNEQPTGIHDFSTEVYDLESATGKINELSEKLSTTNRNLESMYEARNGKNSSSQTIPIKNVGKQKLLLHLHKRVNDGYDVANDVYLPNAENNFADVRIKSDDGKTLPYHVVYKGNIDIIPDKRLGIRLQGTVFTDSNSNMIISRSGLVSISIDNGVTWSTIQGLDIGASVHVVKVTDEDTIFFSTPGVLYRSEAPYTTYQQVLDTTEGYTGHSITSDRFVQLPSGELLVGSYQLERVIRIYKSTDKGLTWRQVINWENTYQHVHGLYVDIHATPITIYAGVDGGGGVLKSTDKGETWLDLRTDLGLVLPQSTDKGVLYSNSRGHKYLGGETAIVGGYSIIKTTDDVNFYPVLGIGNSVLKMNELNGRLIASGNSSSSTSKSHRNTAIYISEDDGETWVQAYTTQPLTGLGANDGFRYMSKGIFSTTDYEQLIIGSNSQIASPLRIVSDENSYYAEIIVEVPDGCVEITVESGYLIANETQLSNTFEIPNKKIISLGLNEGGNYVKENVSGKIFKGDFSYHDVGKHMSVHYPYIINPKDKRSIKLSSLVDGINVGISLSELDAFTISFWGRMGHVNVDIISSLKPTGHDFIKLVDGYQLHSTGGTLNARLRYPVVPDAFAKYDIVVDVLNGTITTYENGMGGRTGTANISTLLTNIANLTEVKLFKVNKCDDNDAIQHLNIYEGALSEDDIYNSYHDFISDNQH